jgi:hypothetical protein
MTAPLSRARGFAVAPPGSKQTEQPARLRGWLRSPVIQGAGALAIYMLVWLTTSAHNMVAHATRAQLDQSSMDPNFYVWCLRWWPFAVVHGHNPLFTHLIGAPAGHSLAWVTTIPPLALLAAPLTLTAGPIVAFNLLSACAVPLAGWAAFLLCRRLTGKFLPALVGGAVFGFSAYEMNHSAAGQLNLTYSLLVPVLAYLIVVWWQGAISSRVFVILAAVILAAQFYLFLETFADMTAMLVLGLILGFALAGRAGRPVIARLAARLGIAYVLAIGLALPYLAYALSTKPPHLSVVTGLDAASLIVPRPGSTYGITWLAHLATLPADSSQAGYIGAPLLVLVILLAVTGWSSRLVRFLTCMLVFIIVASLGPELYVAGRPVARLPWWHLWRLPILRNAYPSRLMLFAFGVLAVAVALWLAGPAKRVWARWSLALLVVAFVALDTPTFGANQHTSVPAFISTGQYKRDLAHGEIVLVVSKVGNAGMLWQAESGYYYKLAGGYVNQSITRRTDLPVPVQALSHATPASVAAFESYIRHARIGAILLDAGHEPPWVGIFWRVGLVGRRRGNVIVYQTSGCRTCRLLNRRELHGAGLARRSPGRLIGR